MSIRKLGTLLCMALATMTANAIDLTPFYRTTLFQGEAKRHASDWITYVDALYTEVATRKTWDSHENRTELFNSHGPFDLRKLAVNLEDLDCYPKTKAYSTGPIPSLTNGNAIFGGRLKLEEFDITLQQNLFWGLYLQGILPIRKVTIKDINYCVCSSSESTALTNFIENDLDDILCEYGIQPLKTNFDSKVYSDPLISVGWHGSCEFPTGMVTGLRGYVQGGVIIPTASRIDPNLVFSVPVGINNEHWAFNARGNVHALLWKKLAVGVNAGATIFLKERYDQRMTTSTLQNGYIILEMGRATTDRGSQWDVTGYVKAERVIGGLSALIGYSYTQQERTTLSLRDDCFLKTAKEHNVIENKDEVINSNKLLDEWYQHVIHSYIEYDFGAHSVHVPSINVRLFYDIPFSAKNSFAKELWGGLLGLGIDWKF